MLNFLPDVYINTDHCRGAAAGKCPGFGISLVAETDSGSYYCYESVRTFNFKNALPIAQKIFINNYILDISCTRSRYRKFTT